MRVFLIVIDSFGIGEMPDANEFGDVGSNTYLNIVKQTNLTLPTMASLGLDNIDGINLNKNNAVVGNYARLAEITKAKDTTAGHYEIAGIILENPFPVFPNAFPQDFLNGLQNFCGVEFIGNEVASGTEIIQRLGEKHQQSLKPIIYTSQDSVLQIAADEQLFGLEKLYQVCQKAREYCHGKYNVARIIARPFTKSQNGFVRTENRHDYALLPPKKSMLDKLKQNNFDVISVGKINDIFCGQGITKVLAGKNNKQALESILSQMDNQFNGLLFANLVDTDMLYGHRNNVQGYADALSYIDNQLETIINNLQSDDIVIVTADHGCDPTTKSTDHSREYVPLLVYGKNLKKDVNFGTIQGFDIISKSILDLFNVEPCEQSLFKSLIQ